MKIFITGINGLLGKSLYVAALTNDYEVVGCGRTDLSMTYYRQLNIENKDKCIELLKAEKPDVVIHCAAWTDVNGSEIPSNQQRVYNTNVIGTKNITEACKEINCKLIYISTDYVYGMNPYILITEESQTNPLNYYGYTKLLGEKEALKYNKTYVVRISWLFGKYGNNFAQTILSYSTIKEQMTVITDQKGRPTNADDLSHLLLEMCNTDKYGIYNVSNEGPYISWYEYAKYLIDNKPVKLIGETSEEYYKNIDAANRPLNSCMSTVKLLTNGFHLLPTWMEALDRYKKGI